MPDVCSLSPRRLRVFLCHASGDKPAVRELSQQLRRDGFQPWLDEDDLQPGQEWELEIRKAVRDADVVLVCLSQGAITKKGFVQKEIKFALDTADEQPEATIFIVPIRLDECSVPERLSRWHWVDFSSAKGYERLVYGLRLRATSLGLDTTPLPGSVYVNPKDELEFVWIPRGKFIMGASREDDAYHDERPQNLVQISKPFLLAKTPVTVAAYKRFTQETGFTMPESPWFNTNWEKGDHPIVNVLWNDAETYCAWAGGRLPTEAEWEYAARGGKEGLRYPWGSELSPDRANYKLSRDLKRGTTPVTEFPPQNDWGLLDMIGNVYEWVADFYDETYYTTLSSNKPVQDPKAPQKISRKRVTRGGCWISGPDSWALRTTHRFGYIPDEVNAGFGFRCLREVIP